MLEREISVQLYNWAINGSDRKCLLIRGARQVGKTFSARRLGNECFESFIEINFLRSPSMKSIFAGDLSPDILLRNITLTMPEASIIPGKTLILLDEIQECPEAVTALKFLAEDKRCKVIATGSMLGIDYNRPASYPVGSVKSVDMYALSFREFLRAMEVNDDVLGYIRDCFDRCIRIEPAVHNKILELLRLYIAIGGMPEAVQIYIDSKDLRLADEKLRQILQDYRYDIAHYATADIKLKAENCYMSIPLQLSKENHKFQYSVVEKGGNSRKYANSLEWLHAADLISFCCNVKSLRMPLEQYQEPDNFRIYPTDIGLLSSMYDYSLKGRIIQDMPDEAKGGLYEALIADMLIKNGHKRLYFRKNEQATFELEFLLPGTDGVIPVEVKSGKSRSRSLDTALDRDEIPFGYKLISGNAGMDGKKITMPLYMGMWL